MDWIKNRVRHSRVAAVARRKLPKTLHKPARTLLGIKPPEPAVPAQEIAAPLPGDWDMAQMMAEVCPVAPAAEMFKVLERLDTAQSWENLLRYYDRLSPSDKLRPKVKTWRALALTYLGEADQGVEVLSQSIPVAGEFRAHPAAVALLLRHLDVAEFGAGLRDRYAIVPKNKAVFELVAVLLWHGKEFEALKVLLGEIAVLFEGDDEFSLFASRVMRINGDVEHAVRLAFQAQAQNPSSSSVAMLALETAGNCLSDEWLQPAVDLGQRFLGRFVRDNLTDRAVVVLTKLCGRLMDVQLRLDILDQLSDLPVTKGTSTYALARGLFDVGQSDRALVLLYDRLALKPAEYDTVLRIAGILADQSKPQEAVDFLHEAVPDAKRDTRYFGLAGHILAWTDRIDEARPLLQKAVQMDPLNYSALADLAFCAERDRAYTLANSLMEKASCLMAVKQAPQTMGLNTMHMNRIRRRMIFVNDCAGNIQMARALMTEAATRNPLVLPYPINEASGEDASGKNVVVLAELGIGDEIRYTCVYSRKLGNCASVLLTCDPRLETLLARSFPAFNVVPVLREFPGIKARRLDERTLATDTAIRKVTTDDVIRAGENADAWIRAIHQFEIDALEHPPYQSPDEPVLKPDPARMAHFAELLRDKAKGRHVVGLSWRGGRRTYNRTPHYFDIEQWAPFLEDENLCFVNLQYAQADQEMDYLRDTLGDRFIDIPDLDLFDDMEGIAALCSQLDLVVAICTNVLELAAAVGTQTLYLMRSPQATHALRLHGDRDQFGSEQDSVWKSCRIIPRFNMTDEDLVARGGAYIAQYRDQNPAKVKASKSTRKARK